MAAKRKVAVVAGATRGAGRGIARALGDAGYLVYCTGRSTPGKPSPYGRKETIDETAALCGGTAVRVDHTDESEVKELFARVVREQGRLDVLVDSVAGEDPLLGGWTGMLETDLSNAERALKQSLLSHVITAKQGALVMKRGLIVEVTEGDLMFGAGGNLISALVKCGVKSLAALLAEELRNKKITVVSVTPGFLRSESMLDHFGVTEKTWREGGKKDPHFLQSETPMLVGRAIVALAEDRNAMEKTGRILSSWDLAREYGIKEPECGDWGTHWRNEVVPSMPALREGIAHYVDWLEAQLKLAKSQLKLAKSQLKPVRASRARVSRKTA